MASPGSGLRFFLTVGFPLLLIGIFLLLSKFWNMPVQSQFLVVVASSLFACSPFFMYVTRFVSCVVWRTLVVTVTAFTGTKKRTFLEDHYYDDIVLPSDLDIFLHMNNARYSHAIDFARSSFYTESGFGLFQYATNIVLLMSANVTRYRKSMKLFQRYRVKTKVVYWTENAFYMENKCLSKFKEMDDFVYCVCLTKMTLNKETTEYVLKKLLQQDEVPKSPEPSEEVAHFIKYIEASSQALKTA